MRRDTIFYQLFRQSPTLLFDLISQPPEDADLYVFDSIEVKETAFRIDGVFLPPDRSGMIFFCEVQFQMGLGLIVLTTLEGEDAKTEAKRLIALAQGSKAIIEIVSTIIVYKFTNLTRDEVDAMLEITLQQTRVYQDAKAEGEAIVEVRGLEAV